MRAHQKTRGFAAMLRTKIAAREEDESLLVVPRVFSDCSQLALRCNLERGAIKATRSLFGERVAILAFLAG